MQSPMNLKEILAKLPEQMTKQELTTIINSIYTQNPALVNPHPKHQTNAQVGGLAGTKEDDSEEVDDEYLPTCCRNGNQHRHPV